MMTYYDSVEGRWGGMERVEEGRVGGWALWMAVMVMSAWIV
jgi:hypothetical protein